MSYQKRIDIEILTKTVYAEARGEPEEGQRWVVWVIKNRAHLNKRYWGGNIISEVCLWPDQFECWKEEKRKATENPDKNDIYYKKICNWIGDVYDAPIEEDPTSGSDHYNNPDKEGFPPWTNNCKKTRKIENHQFYRTKPVLR